MLDQPPLCILDLSSDGIITNTDMLLFLENFERGTLVADVWRDGGIDIRDLLLWLWLWDMGC